MNYPALKGRVSLPTGRQAFGQVLSAAFIPAVNSGVFPSQK